MPDLHGGSIHGCRISADLSVNTNPLGCPEAVKNAVLEAFDHIERYPDMEMSALRTTIGRCCGLESNYVLCGSGASELFMAAVNAIKPRSAMVISPCFSGYAYALGSCPVKEYIPGERNGFEVTRDILNCIDAGTDMLFIANPNNPTGRAIGSKLLTDILEHCREHGIWVVLDECFIELCPDALSMCGSLDAFPRLLIVRAYTKLLAIPGLRFGYVLSQPENLELIAKKLPEWNVSVPAQAAALAGAKLLQDREYLRASLELIKHEKSFLLYELNALGFELFPTDTCFILFRSPVPLFEPLLEHGILIRDCRSFRGLSGYCYRIAIRPHKENELLISTLKELYK